MSLLIRLIVLLVLVAMVAALAVELRLVPNALAAALTQRPKLSQVKALRPPTSGLARLKRRPLSIGFYVNDDDNSLPALTIAAPHLDWLIPHWLSVSGPKLDLQSNVDEGVVRFIEHTKPDILILPMIQNLTDEGWDGAGLATLLSSSEQRKELVRALEAFLNTHDFQGITIDFEEVPPNAQPNLRSFLQELLAAFSPRGFTIVLCVPFDDESWPYETYADLADYLLLMGYDEHWETATAGSIAGQGWFEKILAKRMRDLDPARTIVGLGSYAYDWPSGESAAALSYREGVLLANAARAEIAIEPGSLNPHFSYTAGDGKRHDVWLLDATTALNQIHVANSYQPAGYSVWRLGTEDPLIWSVMGQP